MIKTDEVIYKSKNSDRHSESKSTIYCKNKLQITRSLRSHSLHLLADSPSLALTQPSAITQAAPNNLYIKVRSGDV